MNNLKKHLMKNLILLALSVSFIVTQACRSENTNAQTNSNTEDQPVLAENTSNSEVENKEGGAVHLTKAEFLEKVMNYEVNQKEWKFEGDKPAIIDFYADWCAPCRITSPILDEIAKEYKGKIDVYKIDTEAERELAAVFGIQSLPSFLYIPMNDKPTMSSGIARTKEETKQMFIDNINQLLLK